MVQDESLQSRSERLGGIGSIVCQDIHTGKTWTEYDAEKITQRESEITEALRYDVLGRTFLVVGTLCALARNKIGQYFNK